MWKRSGIARRRHWFELWVKESLSIRLLCRLSGYSASKLKNIKRYWLGRVPRDNIDYSSVRYAIYDATYFHRDGCLLNIMNAVDQRVFAHTYVDKESFRNAYDWFSSLKQQGLNPIVITTDGERSITRAMRIVWPNVQLQRCLYHLQHEGMRWLRTYPKTEAGKKLRTMLSQLSSIKNSQEREAFVHSYSAWIAEYGEFVSSLPRTTVASKDLKRTMVLLQNALPDMFYYLHDNNVHPTTNALESFHSRLKSDYQRHRGLTREHRIQYIRWYCHFKNQLN